MALADVEQGLAFLFRRTVPAMPTAIPAAEAIPPLRAILIVNGQATVATGFATPHGFTLAGAAQGALCSLVTSGTVPGAVSAAVIGQRYWLTTTGAATPTEPVTPGARKVRIGFATSPVDVCVAIEDQGTVP